MNSFSPWGLVLPYRLRTNYPLNAYPLSNSDRLPQFSPSSHSHACANNSSKPILCTGSFTNALAIKSLACCEICLGNSKGRLKLSLISCWVNFSALKKGEHPKSIWYATTPKLQISHFQLYSRRSKISGAIVKGVPTTDLKYSSCACERAKPKSASLISKSFVTRMFESFRSRCTTRCCLMARNAAFSFSITCLTLGQGRVPPQWAERQACRSEHSQCSKTRYKLRAVCLKSNSATMFSCLIRESTATYCWMRSNCFPDKFSRDICLTANRPPDASRASKTVEQEPLPITRSKMQGPILRHFLLQDCLQPPPCYIRSLQCRTKQQQRAKEEGRNTTRSRYEEGQNWFREKGVKLFK